MDSAALLREVGGSEALKRMASLFYDRTFADPHLGKFVMDEHDPHAERLANWITEMMGGEGQPWSAERADRLVS